PFVSAVSFAGNQRGCSFHLPGHRATRQKAKHAAFEVKSPESDRRFTQKLWKTLWKRSSFTAMLPANGNVLAVCTKAGRPTTPGSSRPKPTDYTVAKKRRSKGSPPVRGLSA